jgi:hypothetical protein
LRHTASKEAAGYPHLPLQQNAERLQRSTQIFLIRAVNRSGRLFLGVSSCILFTAGARF